MELPFEILVYIFKYLPKSDRKAASETCRAWYTAANDKCFLDKTLVIFYKIVLSEEEYSPLQIFVNSPTDYCNFLFNEVELSNKFSEFWDSIGENVRGLTLRNCDTCEKVLINILQKCPNLVALEMHSCRELFMSGCQVDKHPDGITTSFTNLRVLSLAGNQYLTDKVLNGFLLIAPNIQELNLSACSLQFHMGLFKRFYPALGDVTLKPSESVLTFYYVLQFIISRAKYIKRLLFSNTLIDGTALISLSEVPDLKLEALEVYSCDQLTFNGISALTNHQTTLRELNIGMCSRVADQSIIHISKNLINLEVLNIQRCRGVTDLGIAELNRLKKLKSLNISQCELITKSGLEKGICSETNKVLQELDIHSLNLDQNGLIMISEKLPNLLSLDISFCFNAVTDTSIQVIFKNQVLLHTLKMSQCDKVSDAGLTGMGTGNIVGDYDEQNSVISETDDISNLIRIHLGSRAEEEIMRDARRKRDVMMMCEKLSTDTYTGYSLTRMKSLRELDISGCNRITDVSLTYAFNFKELILLNMSRCQQITHEGIEHLVQNCPSIEYFNLIDCYNLKDEAITKIVKGLRRLKQLELRGCNQLTDNTLEAVWNHCKILKFLDIQGCRNINPDYANSVSSLPSLHTLLVSKPGPYITDGLKNRSPAPKFLPAMMKKLLYRQRDAHP